MATIEILGSGWIDRRCGRQAIVACLATLSDGPWKIHHERLLYDARAFHQGDRSIESGIDQLDAFSFGFPTAVALVDGTALATHWCVEDGTSGVRRTRLRVAW